MTKFRVEIQPEKIKALANARAVIALSELVWNSFDADAENIWIRTFRNALDGLDRIEVKDDGHGISHDDAIEVFSKFGGSWKKEKQRSKTKQRILHGKEGQGRYRAFALGKKVEWTSVYLNGSKYEKIHVQAHLDDITNFDVSDPEPVDANQTGTTVTISSISKEIPSFDDAEQISLDLALRFAPSLRQYPSVKIKFDKKWVNPSALEERSDSFDLPSVTLESGELHEVKIEIVEWNTPVERKLYLCDEAGFTLDQVSPGIHAPEFVFTAYIKSSYIRYLEDNAALAFGDGHPEYTKLLENAKDLLRNHFLSRRAELASDLIESWKTEEVYPFDDVPADPVEAVERQVFDVVAKNIHDYLPSFDQSEQKSKKLSLHLLRHAIESSPGDVQRIIENVLQLPADKARDLADLLSYTELTHIIEASKTVTRRLDFLRGLEILLYDPESRKTLLERAQLQKILEEQTWIFGEQFSLSVGDQSLNEVLKKHVAKLGRDGEVDYEDNVEMPDGSKGIVDLMLSRRIPQPSVEKVQHLVVEIKRPKQSISTSILQKVEDYALAVARDERFRSTETSWVFWALSNELTDSAKIKVGQDGRPYGQYSVLKDDGIDVQVWAVPWSYVIRQCKARMSFYQERLNYEASDDAALKYLQDIHNKYLPKHLQKE